MHILLTDLLTCPRCGPQFGLIVLADRLENRNVTSGSLGCANCRQRYEIAAGVADLRVDPGGTLRPELNVATDAEQAFRIAALIGVSAPRATIGIVEPAGELAPAIAEILPEVHVLGISPDQPVPDDAGRGFLSRIMGGDRLPLRSAGLHGVAVHGIEPGPLLEEIRRILVPGARLVVDPAADDLSERLRGAGFSVVLEQDGVVVAGAPERR